jgi:hypothetical protein
MEALPPEILDLLSCNILFYFLNYFMLLIQILTRRSCVKSSTWTCRPIVCCAFIQAEPRHSKIYDVVAVSLEVRGFEL